MPCRIACVRIGRFATGALVPPAPASAAGASAIAVPRGEAILTTTTVLNAALARGAHREQAYLVTGLVTADLLEQAVTALVTDPVAEGTG